MKKKNLYRQLSVIYQGTNYVYLNDDKKLSSGSYLPENIGEERVFLKPFELFPDKRMEEIMTDESFDPWSGNYNPEENWKERYQYMDDYWYRCYRKFKPGTSTFRSYDPEGKLWDKYYTLIHQ